MPKWRVHVSYWCGFTKDRVWQDNARAVFEAQGWTEIHFWNGQSEGFVPWSSSVDADEIDFVVHAEGLDKATVERELAQVGIEYTAYITIEQRTTE
jgi:hypothetical protein